ncbi:MULTISPECIES: septum site-determining protein Ssd [unclassified Arthrobacter]|uniref:septum site-determining protein Ssd n=1 Tax=unclassified Arthrobacter TaxID=235627 RepID=UPI001E51C96D|nr:MULTISPECIES: septum site-determining protein Ssd [unclassified Arthrobacter]MCC9144714.1 hypothetical protein [Arthrobacter sp. zg-Y919]MDK1275940.1 hypothetical protein [Arthrobacter sp. zg.Y919]WIB02706.1 hypothetical protein QNO10_12250 [Arthrobacter sp. zg-Y919]
MNEEQGTQAYASGRAGPLPEPDGRRGRRLRGTMPGEGAVVVLVAEDQGLRDEVARLAAAAGVEISVAAGVADALALEPEVLLLGSDHVRSLAERGGGERGIPGVRAASSPGALPPGAGKTEVIVVGLAPDTGIWDVAAASSAARVAILPAAAGWLAGYLSRQRSVSGGVVLGVLGGCGGAGASAVACWLSAGAADRGEPVLLVEGDPWGAGLEWVLGAGELEGIRWPDLVELSGSLNPVQLAAGLPALAGFSLLARGGGQPSPDVGVIRAVMDAARSGYGLTLVDLGRAMGPDCLLPFCDQVLLVVPGRAAGILAARTLLPYLGPVPVQVVVRGSLGDGLDELRTAEALGLPLAGYVPSLKGMDRAMDTGRVLSCLGRPGIRRGVRRILDQVLPRPAGAHP